jgi:hypothetical protein
VGKTARIGLRIAAGLLIGLLLLAGGTALWLASYDWNDARSWVGKQVERRTGRTLVIEGPLTVNPFSLQPHIRAANVTFANAAWGEKEPMFSAGLLDLRVDLWHLFYGRVVITQLVLENGTALLQRDLQGRRNWILKPPGEEHKGRSPELLQLQIRDSRVRVKDDASNTDVTAQIQSQPNEKVWGMKVSAAGTVRGVSFKLAGDSGGLLQIMDEHKPYPIRLSGTLGQSKASAEGTLTGVATLQDLDVDMTLSGSNMAPLGEVLKLSLPHTKPYTLAGRLERRGPEWRFIKTRGKVGSSDLAGDFTVRTDRERPLLTASLKSDNLDIADLGGFVGTRPGATEATHAPGKVLPSEPINVEKLNRIDANVRLTAGHFQNADKFPLDNLDATLDMKGGQFRLDPVNFGVADGKVSVKLSVDARAKQLKTNMDTTFTKLHINRLVPGTQKIDESFGAVDGRLKLAGTGNSPAAMLGTASGRLDLHSNGGSMSKLALKIASVQVLDIVRYMIGGDEQAQLRCAVMSFKMDKGVAKSDVIVVDTDDTIIGGGGTVSLKDETLDLSLVPLPKDPAPLQLRGPLYVRGPFVKPDYGIDKKALARKVGSSLLLGLINPLAAIVPLIETGPGKDAPCGQLIATVEAAASGKKAAPAEKKTAAVEKPKGG